MTTIKAKFSIDQIIFYLCQNIVMQGKITEIDVNVKEKTTCITYKGKRINSDWGFSEIEHRIFATKQDLLDSL